MDNSEITQAVVFSEIKSIS